MTLLWSTRSPFVRKVMVVAHELGLADSLALRRVVVSGASTTPEVMALNPLNRIPTLLLPEGAALFDSRVIVEYLSDRAGGALLPEGPARWSTLRLQALGDGLMELSLQRLAEAARGEARSIEREAASAAKVAATLDFLEQHVEDLAPTTLGSIAVACALAYLDFRFAPEAWSATRPALAAWHSGFSARPSMRATAFQDVY